MILTRSRSQGGLANRVTLEAGRLLLLLNPYSVAFVGSRELAAGRRYDGRKVLLRDD